MKKSSVVSMAFLAVGAIGMLTPAFVSRAEVLDDSDVGITYALDQYVESLNVKEIKEEDVTTEEAAPTCQYPDFDRNEVGIWDCLVRKKIRTILYLICIPVRRLPLVQQRMQSR